MRTLTGTPRDNNYRMPGEFERHQCVFLLWPQRPDNWRNGGKPVQRTFVQLVATIAQLEPVVVGVNDDQYDNAYEQLSGIAKIVEISHDDSWVRDTGATFVKNDEGGLRGIDWGFNAWGGLKDGLYFPWEKDNRVATKMIEQVGVKEYRNESFILEGGSFHVDGQGTLITTEECLLSSGRNPELSKNEIEKTLKEYLNVSKIIWLKGRLQI